MKSERDKYGVLMAEIELRLENIENLYRSNNSTTYDLFTTESICLQFRKTLELIAFSSLVSHKDSYMSVRNDIRRDWHAERILKKVESINKYFYPVPLKDPKHHSTPFKRGNYLTRKQFSNLYDKCGNILHARNPFNRFIKPVAFYRKIPNNVSRIKELLRIHLITFFDSDEVICVEVPFGNKSKPIQIYTGEIK